MPNDWINFYNARRGTMDMQAIRTAYYESKQQLSGNKRKASSEDSNALVALVAPKTVKNPREREPPKAKKKEKKKPAETRQKKDRAAAVEKKRADMDNPSNGSTPIPGEFLERTKLLTTRQIDKLAPYGGIIDKLSPEQVTLLVERDNGNSPDGKAILKSRGPRKKRPPASSEQYVAGIDGHKIYL